MAITINGGTNAITGLAAGGLPDGSVDADTLAANAVTDTKIAANAVTDAKIAAYAVTTVKIAADAVDGTKIPDDAIAAEHVADDAVGVAQLSTTGTAGTGTYLRGDNSWQAAGGGKCEKVWSDYTSSNFSINNGSWTDITGQSCTITPVKAGSTIVVWMDQQHYIPEPSRSLNMQVVREINSSGTWNSIGQSGPSYEYSSQTDRMRGRGMRCIVDEPSYTVGQSIIYKAQARTSGGNIQINQDGMTGGLCIMEVSD